MAYIHCRMFLQDKNYNHLIRIQGELSNAIEHAKYINMYLKQETIKLLNNIISNKFKANDLLFDKMIQLYNFKR